MELGKSCQAGLEGLVAGFQGVGSGLPVLQYDLPEATSSVAFTAGLCTTVLDASPMPASLSSRSVLFALLTADPEMPT